MSAGRGTGEKVSSIVDSATAVGASRKSEEIGIGEKVSSSEVGSEMDAGALEVDSGRMGSSWANAGAAGTSGRGTEGTMTSGKDPSVSVIEGSVSPGLDGGSPKLSI